MKHKFKLLLLLVLSVAIAAGMDSCKKDETDPKAPQWWSQKDDKKNNAEPEQQDDPIEDSRVKMFEQVIPVQESEITSVKSDTAAHHYTITYNNTAPEIKPGNVVVVRDGNETRIILVTNANVSGNKAELDGPLGDLSYVFYDTKFRISTDPNVIGTEDSPVFRPRQSNSLQKKASFDIESDGESTELKFNYSRSLSWEFGTDTLYKHDANEQKIDWFDNKTLVQPSLIENPDLVISRIPSFSLEFSTDVKLKVTSEFVFTEPVESWWEEVLFLHAALFTINGEVEGSITLAPKAELSLKEQITWSKKRYELFKCPDVNIVFPVGPVPVDLVLRTPILADFELSVSGEMKLQLPIELKGGIKWGFSWDPGHNKGFTPEDVTFDWNFDFKPSLAAKAKVSAKISVYPEFRTFLYTEKIGATAVAPKAILNLEYGVGAKATLDFNLKNNFERKITAGIGTDFTASIGFEAGLGFIVPFTSKYKKIKDIPISISKKFYESPTGLKIKDINGINFDNIFDNKGGFIDYQVVKDQPVSIKYTAMSAFDFFVHRDWEAFMPHIYEYGKLPDECYLGFGCGDQTIDWTPESELDYLDIVIANSSGKDIGKTRIGHKPKVDFKFVDETGSQIYSPFKKQDNVKLVVTSDIPVDFTLIFEDYKPSNSNDPSNDNGGVRPWKKSQTLQNNSKCDYFSKNVKSVTIPLRTDFAREINLSILAEAANGFKSDELTFKYRINNEYGGLDSGEPKEKPFFETTVITDPNDNPNDNPNNPSQNGGSSTIPDLPGEDL